MISRNQLDYRKDVDGLRAVAIILVILYHTGVPWFSGGFVGVDVFFVISGYLITRILFREPQDGAFSLGRFYQQRALRILPALIPSFAVLVCFQIFGSRIARAKERFAHVPLYWHAGRMREKLWLDEL